jgi:SAM-dependent methyltransferase
VVGLIAADLGGAIWHDLECGSYRADLPLWRELAREAGGAVLDIGCGTGRVALDLAAQGHAVTGLDSDPELIKGLAQRAREDGTAVQTVVADARSFDLGRRFALAIAPMQVTQLLGGASGRTALLGCVLRHLEPGGTFAAALADPYEGVELDTALPPLPDVREQDRWVLSSTPVAVRRVDGAIEIDHHRQAVSPAGELTETLVTIRLDSVAPATLESEAEAAGLTLGRTRRVPETHEHVGSTVVLLEAPR